MTEDYSAQNTRSVLFSRSSVPHHYFNVQFAVWAKQVILVVAVGGKFLTFNALARTKNLAAHLLANVLG